VARRKSRDALKDPQRRDAADGVSRRGPEPAARYWVFTSTTSYMSFPSFWIGW
jgi:hypothetical protein